MMPSASLGKAALRAGRFYLTMRLVLLQLAGFCEKAELLPMAGLFMLHR